MGLVIFGKQNTVMKYILSCLFVLLSLISIAQKKPLDHSVYDGWQSIADRTISRNGQYLAFAVNPQEGDGVLYVKTVTGQLVLAIPRGYAEEISADSRYLVCKIKAPFADTRAARIKKAKPDDIPKDSLAILELSTGKLEKVARVKSFALPDESGQWLAYLLDKPLADAKTSKTEPDSAAKVQAMIHAADSLVRVADSLRKKAVEVQATGFAAINANKKTPGDVQKKTPEEPVIEGTELVLVQLINNTRHNYALVKGYLFDKKGTTLVIETSGKNHSPGTRAGIQKIDLANLQSTMVMTGLHDAKQFSMDESGTQLAFVAERDSSSKALQKFYRLYYFKNGMDSALILADRHTPGMPANWTVSENARLEFSKNGLRLLAGTAPILPPKDTSLPEFDRVSLDVWNYKDDNIQPVQVKTLDRELKRSYMVSIDLATRRLVQLGNEHFRNVLATREGDGSVFYATSDFGKRIPAQWQGFTFNDLYTIDPVSGNSELITKDFKGNIVFPSYSGRYLLFYDERKPGYFVFDANTRKTHPVAKDIKTSLSDEDNDVPDDPNAYGVVKWTENDHSILIYDRYDIWQVDPEGKQPSQCLTPGRKDRIQYRYVNTDPDEKYLKMDHPLLLRLFDEKDKSAGLALLHPENGNTIERQFKEPVSLGFQIQKAKDAPVLLYSKESFEKSTDMYVQLENGMATQLSHTNPQQAGYNWGSSELFTWKAYTGKQTEGILYKPEGFDPKKKYPMIVYFYERNNQTLHNYQAPAPTPSRLNIPFFVSRGYVVFVPDIWYKTGHPGQGAYDYILSGTRAVVKQGYVDSTRIGLQGQSWGGFQIVYLITKTNLYKAAWAGAPVSNMTSAYGGIRWGSGLLRQFQYEKTQSRIGATLWEKPNLYIENSALFSLPKVTTPLVIMANDADDAVPWYQGIEMFAGMRRLGKKVWMLTYNGEVHNLMQRKNRKDISIREQQFFDYMLKGDKPATWISEGVPAVMKGRDLGLGYK